MIFGKVDVQDFQRVQKYLEQNYPDVFALLSSFKLSSAPKMSEILKALSPGEQLTFHAFPGCHLEGNAYIHPRFLRVEAKGNDAFMVTRGKSIRDRVPVQMSSDDVIEYYYELADITFMQAQQEMIWTIRWPGKIKRFR